MIGKKKKFNKPKHYPFQTGKKRFEKKKKLKWGGPGKIFNFAKKGIPVFSP